MERSPFYKSLSVLRMLGEIKMEKEQVSIETAVDFYTKQENASLDKIATLKQRERKTKLLRKIIED